MLFTAFAVCRGCFLLPHSWYPHSLAVAVKAKNSPPDCFSLSKKLEIQDNWISSF
nr:MAG TPA: hypothetical protein [Caudoviricetes sp.]